MLLREKHFGGLSSIQVTSLLHLATPGAGQRLGAWGEALPSSSLVHHLMLG